MTTTTDLLAKAETDLGSMTPAEIDHLIFPLWVDRYVAFNRAFEAKREIGLAWFPEAAHRDRYGRRDRSYLRTQRDFDGAFERVAKAEEFLAETKAKLDPLEAEFDSRPWTRFVLVGGGHLHVRHCHTLRPTTGCLLLAEASGLTDDEVVAKYSYTACSHCFPNAPVAEPMADPTVCTGSGKGVPDADWRRKYHACPVCGDHVVMTSRGVLRKHKVPVAK